MLLDKDNQAEFPEKYSLRGRVQWEQWDTSFKAQNIPQAHAEGAEVQGSARTAYHSCSTQSENWKRVSGLLPSVGLLGCSVLVGVVLPWEWEEEERELSLELLRVSVLVLVLFIFLLLAKGALSTFWRQNPSLLYLLKACREKGGVGHENYSTKGPAADSLASTSRCWGYRCELPHSALSWISAMSDFHLTPHAPEKNWIPEAILCIPSHCTYQILLWGWRRVNCPPSPG